MTKNYSHAVVIPFFNERENAVSLLTEILAVQDQLGMVWEYILISDGGTDGTPAILQKWAAEHPDCMVLHMPGNQGQAASLFAGLHQVTAQLIITMDGDGQNVPADIPNLLGLIPSADMVVGIRSERNDSPLRRVMSRWANRIRGRLLGDNMTDSGCALKVFHRRLLPALLPIKTLYSFMPAMAVAAGFTVAQVSVQHRARDYGQSNYGLRAFFWRPVLDMMGMWWFKNRCITLHPRSRKALDAPLKAL